MASIGRWTGGAVSAVPTTTLAAPSGFFATESRNDGSIYSLNSSTATLTLPSSDLADGYLVVAYYKYEDTSNGRANFQGTFQQTSGTGNFVASLTGGYNRNNSNDFSYVRSWAFIDSPSASAQIQFLWSRDSDTPTGGITESSFEVIPLFYKSYVILESTSTSFPGGTTPTAIPGFSVSSGSGTGTGNFSISLNDELVLPNNAKIWMLQSFGMSYNSGDRTQRWGGFLYNGTKVDYAKSYSYYRNASNGKVGNFSTLALNSGSADTIQTFLYRGDGVANLEGGADVDGATTGTSPCYRLVALELNDNASFLTDVSTANSTNLNLQPTLSESITTNATADWLFAADIAAASSGVGSTTRGTYKATALLGTTQQTYTSHGNYIRGNQGNADTFGWSANLLSAISATSGDSLGVKITLEGNSHNTVAPSGWVGLKALNLDSLSASTPVTVNVTGVSATGSVNSVTTSGDSSTTLTGVYAASNFSPEYDLTLEGTFGETSLGSDFTARNVNVVFAGEVQLLSSYSQTECLWEHGGTGIGAWLGVSKISNVYYLRFRAGEGDSAVQDNTPTDIALQNIAISDIPEFDGGVHTVVFDIRINPGRVRLWIDGRQVIGVTSTAALEGNLWSGSNIGGWGAGYSDVAGGNAVTDAGATQYQALTGWSGTIASRLRVYSAQQADFGADVTVTGDSSVTESGLSATGSVGSVTVTGDSSVTETGVSATGAVGSVTVTGDSSVTETGVSATGAVGSVTVTGDSSVTESGLSATGAVGSVTVTGDSSVTETGVSATGAVGSVTINTAVNVTVEIDLEAFSWGAGAWGDQAWGASTSALVGVTRVGSVAVTGDSSVVETGVSATGAVGSVTVTGDSSVVETGLSATGAVGSVTVTGDSSVTETGVSATGAVGSVTVTGDALVIETGVSATGAVGSVTVNSDADVTVTGLSATVSEGSVTVSAGADVSPSGLSATGAVGSVTVTGDSSVIETGVSATGSVGSVTVTGDALVIETGVSATGAVGSVTTTGQATISPEGLSASNNFSPEYDLTLSGTEPEGQLSADFSPRNQDITLAGEVQLPSSFTQTVCLWEHGGTGIGSWLGVSKISNVYYLRFRAGEGDSTVQDNTPTDIALQNVAISNIPEFDGNTHTVVFEIRRITGRIRLWIDGREVINQDGGGNLEGNSWSGGDVGGWGAGYSGIAGGTAVTDAGATQYQSATSWPGTIDSDLRYYSNQLADFGADVTVTGEANVSPSGLSATGAVGTVTVNSDANVSVTGLSATGSVGSVTVTGDALVVETGVSATGSVGSVTVTGDAVVVESGLSATGSVGSVTVTGDALVVETGVAATGAVGTVTVNSDANVSVTGLSATVSEGSVTVFAGADVSPSGISATGSVGSVTVTGDAIVVETGVSATGAVGSVTANADANATVTGESATGAVGTVTVDTGTSVIVTPTGVSATGSVGSVTTATGVTAFAGTTGWGVDAWGDQLWGGLGDPALESTGEIGSVSIVADSNVTLSGVQAATNFSPEYGLTLSGVLPEGEVNGTFTDRINSIVFAGEAQLPSSFTYTQTLWEHGGESVGSWLGVSKISNTYYLRFRARNGSVSVQDNTPASIALQNVAISNIPEFDGNTHTVAFEIRSGSGVGNGRIRLWIDQRLVIDTEAGEAFPVWGGTNPGGWGSGHSAVAGGDDVTDGGATQYQALTAWSGNIVSDLRYYSGGQLTDFGADVTVTGDAVVVESGLEATGAVGSVTVTGDAIVVESGLEATGSIGSVTVNSDANVSVTGLSATGSVGSVTVTGEANVTPSGIAATGSVGSVTVTGDANTSVTGISATGAVGSVTVSSNADVDVTGVSATVSEGSVTVSAGADVSPSGLSATGSIGSVTVTGDAVVVETGVEATGAIGTATVNSDANIDVTGVSATGSVGSTTVVTGVNVKVGATSWNAGAWGDQAWGGFGDPALAATGAVGSVTVNSNADVDVTGVSATVSEGSVTVFAGADVSPSGIAATGAVGSVTVIGDAIVVETGVEATGAVGSVTVNSNADVDVTGVSATVSEGSVTVISDANVTVTGVEATGEVGTVTVVAEAIVVVGATGWGVDAWGDQLWGGFGDPALAGTGEVGDASITADANVSPSGLEATGAVGTVTVNSDANVSVTGVSATGSVGSVTVVAGAVVTPSGLEATGAVGSVTVAADANVSVTGVEATGEVGTVTVIAEATVVATGVSATGEIGSATVVGDANVSTSGLEATGAVGTVTVAANADIDVTGVSVTGEVGTVSIAVGIVEEVTGVESTGSLGTVTVSTPIAVIGVQAVGRIGNVLVWGQVPTDQTPDWQAVNDGQTPDWTDVPTNQSPDWQDVDDTQTSSWEDVGTAQTPNWDEIAA